MLITNASVITMGSDPQIIHGQGVLVQDGFVVKIGDTQNLRRQFPDEAVIDARGQYLMPANICAHTHFYGAFARGMAIPGAAPADFPQILEKLWWGLDKSLDLNDVYYSTMVCLIDAIKHGTTTLFDHHASPNAIDGSLDVIAKAILETGLRASLSYEVTDRDGPARAKAGIDENIRFHQQLAMDAASQSQLSSLFGLHASLTLSSETLTACRRAVEKEGMGVHVHAAEHSIDEYDSLAKSGLRVIDRLDQYGLLGPQSIVGHAVHVDAREIEILARTRTWVTHQPRSNMNNAVGLPEVEGMMRSGVKVCLGNDGFSNAMWEEWKTAYLAHKLWKQDLRRMQGGVVQEMAVTNNAALAAKMFNGLVIGEIRPGAAADLILVNYAPFTDLTPGNLPWHIIFGFNESMITTTIASGKVLMLDRKLTTIDEEQVVFEARKASASVWKRYQAIYN